MDLLLQSLDSKGPGSLQGMGPDLGQGLEQIFPAVAVLFPSADGAHALKGGFAHGALKAGVVGELLQSAGEGGRVTDGNNKAFDAIGEEVLTSGVG